MRYGLVTVIVSLLTGSIKPVLAQQYIFKNYAMNDGLVHNAVRKIYQDSKGFLWIGTWEGLSKYDGHRFTNYSSINGLSNDFINDILEAKDGSIHITCNDGGIYRITNNGYPQKIKSNHIVVNSLVSLPDKIIALTDSNGIHEFRDEKLLKPMQASGGNTYYNLASFNDSLLLVQSNYSLQLLNKHYRLLSEQKEKTPIYTECGMLKDSKNRMWIGTIKGLKLLSPTLDKGFIRFLDLPPAFNHPLLQRGWIRAILEDAEGNLWFGVPQGLLKIETNGSQRLLTEKNGLPANDVSCIYQDREKNIWVGGSRGVARLVTATSILLFRTEDGLASNNLSHVLPLANGDILTGSDNGTQLYKKSTGRFEPATENLYDAGEKTAFHSLLSHASDNRYLIFQQKPFHFTFFSPTPIGEYYAFKDSFGNYFTSSTSGILVSKNLKNWQNSFYFSDTRTIMLDSKGDLWAGTKDNGLLHISYKSSNGIPQKTGQKHFFPGIGIRSLYEDSKGNIWAGSRYLGVFCISKNGNMIHQFNQASGLTSNRITSIAEDKDGAIWLSFYSGLDKLVPENNTYRVFNFSRFHNFFANIQAMVIDNQHSLWLGTMQGLVNITDGKTEKTSPLKTIITSAVLGDSVYHSASDEKTNLGYLQNQVHFEYAAPGFMNEKQILYSYRLLGSNNIDWSQAFNEHSVSYASLRPGDYQFEVRTLGWNGVWGEPARFEFSIASPFWQTWWFRICTAILISGLVFVFVRRRIKTIWHEAEMKHKLTETEMAALRAQMNPHFIFNCLNAIDNLIQTNQKEKATTYLARFARLIRSVLDSSKNNVVIFQKDYESLQLYLQMERFRCNNKFEYELAADDELLHGDYKLPPLIVQPFVENAINHGLLNKQTGERKLTITASLENDFIKYIVSDNGVGRTRAQEIKSINNPGQESYGINITRERIHLYNRNGRADHVLITDIIENEKPAGTKVEIHLKIYNNN